MFWFRFDRKNGTIRIDIGLMPTIRQASDTELAAYYEAGDGQ
jgi:hypothetical protein